MVHNQIRVSRNTTHVILAVLASVALHVVESAAESLDAKASTASELWENFDGGKRCVIHSQIYLYFLYSCAIYAASYHLTGVHVLLLLSSVRYG